MRPRREVLLSTFADPSTFPSVLDTPVDAEKAPLQGVTAPVAAEVDTPTAVVEEAVEEVQEAVAVKEVTFGDLGLPRDLVSALGRQGINIPFDIQAATIPDALSGRDVLGRGQTGSGKTLAFGLPVLARIATSGRAQPHRPKALILVPTRELAMQVNDSLVPLGRSLGVFLKTAVGGVPYDRQMDALRRGVEIMVATPGRLKDLIERGACSLDQIQITVLDEADQMADMGFLPEVTDLLAKTPEGGQRLLFSATLDGDVDALVKRFMNNPVTHSTAPAEASVSTMDHHMLLIPPHDKFAVTASIAARAGKTMVFARTQMGVDRLVEQLAAVGVRAGALHGGKTQRVRTRTLAEFKEGRTNVLVATDVAARGIHVDGVSLVVHVDPPKDPKDYLHRAGRTARAGESGAVATLVLPKQRRTTLAMMQKAGVEPGQYRVKAGDEELSAVTGAREPSGIPVKPDPEPERRPRRDGDRPRGRFGDRPRGDRGFGDRGFGDRPRGDRGVGDRGFGDRPRGDRGFGDRGFGDRPRGDRGVGDRPSYGDRPRGERTYGDRPTGDRPSYGDRAGYQSDRPRTEHTRSWSDRPRAERSFATDRPRTDRPATGDRRFADRNRTDRGYGDRRPASTH